jgi:hypothetical protein
MLNDKWGHVNDAQFFTQQVVTADINDQGQFVYQSFTERTIEDLLENRSLWSARIGIEFDF